MGFHSTDVEHSELLAGIASKTPGTPAMDETTTLLADGVNGSKELRTKKMTRAESVGLSRPVVQ
jgi:hypothetical protein